MVLLGWPAIKPSSTWRSRSDKVAEPRFDGRPVAALSAAGPIERGLDCAEDRLLVERFLDEVDGAGLHRLDRQRHVAVTGDDDGREVACLGAKLVQQFEPGHVGHAHVGDRHPLFSSGSPARKAVAES